MTVETVEKTVSIREVFKEVIRTTDTLDNEEFAKEVLSRIPEDEYEEYLLSAISKLRPVFINEFRRIAEEKVRVAHAQARNHPKPGKGQVIAVSHTTSAFVKKDEVVKSSRDVLFLQVTQSADGKNIRLGKSTYEDLVFQSTQMISHGQDAILHGEKRALMAEAVKQAGVKTLDELPEAVLEKLDI